VNDVRVPRRFRWLKRLAILGAAVCTLLVTARLCWGLLAEHRLTAALERSRAAGEPVLQDDFTYPDVALWSSAAGELPQGLKLLWTGKHAAPNLNDDMQCFLTIVAGAASPELTRLVENNAAALNRIRSAAGRPYVVWPPAHGAGGLDPERRSYELLILIRLCYVAALHAHIAGDDGAAFADVHRGL